MPTFSVRCVFRWAPRDNQLRKYVYEERITLWQSDSIDEAIAMAENEARSYATDGDEYLEYCQGYALFEEIDANGIEVFSLLRDSDLEPAQYLDTFFDTGLEREVKA